MENCKLLLFDLDGTLLRSDKTISQATLQALRECREKGILIGVSTSRGEQNALSFIEELQPDILIASGGALVKYHGEYIYKAEFTGEETWRMIAAARKICGTDCEITIDTIDSHYWNYKIDPKKQDHSWGDSIYTDFSDFHENSLKMCVEIFEENQAKQLQELLHDCDCIRFSDGYWYKFTRKDATKERAIPAVCSACGIKIEEITAFGDDYADIGMLTLCGKGVAMGNAIDEVKEKADLVIGSNDEDGIAEYLGNKIMDNKDCRECLYYNGNIRPTHYWKNFIIEQCGKKRLEGWRRDHHVKHGKSNNVICAFEGNYRYCVFVLVGEYNRFERVQITKEEYDSFYEWEGDALKVNEIIDRKLGCDACRNPVMISKEKYLEKIGSSMVKQAELWKCKECGTLWEYGVHNNEIVDPSYAEHCYNVNSKTD